MKEKNGNIRASKELNARVLECVQEGDIESAIDLVVAEDQAIETEFWDPFRDPDVERPFTLLGCAVGSRRKELVAKVIELGADVNRKSIYGSLLAHASALGNDDIVELFLAAGADVHAKYFHADDSNETALIAATGSGNIILVRRLLDAGADPKAVSKRGITATHGAVLARSLEMISMLLSAGCPVGAMDLHVPVCKRDLELVRLLLAAKPDVNGQWRYPSPPIGVYRGDIPLHLVAARSAEDVPLLTRPARFPTEKAIEKLGPEMRARRLAILDSLIAAGADVNRVRPNSGHTPLTLAVKDTDLEIVERLLKAGANPLAETKIKGKKATALSLAQQANATELIALLDNTSGQSGFGGRS
ncbi:MAG TPA: hypothetical protein DCY13_16010 [Verrucomicrobiales bacterium]|nr:hypothetical protein [Verrucomicrobiales bacterium]